MAKNEKKTEVLLTLLQDVQENIRFLETKVGVVIILLTGIVALYITDIGSFIMYFDKYSILLKLAFFMSSVGLISSIYFITIIILPVQNPIEKIPKPYRSYPNIYQAKNKSWNASLIVKNFDEALKSDENLNKALELEYLKTSFIRNVKNNNFKRLVIVCVLTLAFVVGQFTIKKIEDKNKAIIENKCL